MNNTKLTCHAGSGAVPHIALSDCGVYVRWLFDNPSRANGMDLEVATDHVHYADLAKAFAAVTLDDYFANGPLSKSAALPSGYNSALTDPAAMTNWQNFTGFWNMWKASG